MIKFQVLKEWKIQEGQKSTAALQKSEYALSSNKENLYIYQNSQLKQIKYLSVDVEHFIECIEL